MAPLMQRPAITVYCASARGINQDFLAAARIFGEALGESGMNLVYGGGGIGLMGELARSAQKSGAHVTGIITEQFLHLEQGWTGCDEMIVVDSMRERKRQLEERGAGFAILAGGLGTWEEFLKHSLAVSSADIPNQLDCSIQMDLRIRFGILSAMEWIMDLFEVQLVN